MRRRGQMTAAVLAISLSTFGCGGGSDEPDDASTPDGRSTCETDSECDDGMFCNGVERCTSEVTGSPACVAGEPPCETPDLCDEDADSCDAGCGTESDADGDGHEAVECGGDDCDDTDGNRFPGNAEVCDVDDHDEDCDPSTFGFRDEDGDGFGDADCCNVDDEGELVCGDDCNDANSNVHPTEAEACNDIDDDCDGIVDEDTGDGTCWPDEDGDGWPAAGSDPVSFCSGCPDGFTATEPTAENGDCDDTMATVYPGAPEICNGIDNNCSGDDGSPEDMDGDMHSAPDAPCIEDTSVGFPKDDCLDGDERVFPGQTFQGEPRCADPCSCDSGPDGCPGLMGVCLCLRPAWDFDCDGEVFKEPVGCSGSCGGLVSGCGSPGPTEEKECGEQVNVYSSCSTCDRFCNATIARGTVAYGCK